MSQRSIRTVFVRTTANTVAEKPQQMRYAPWWGLVSFGAREIHMIVTKSWLLLAIMGPWIQMLSWFGKVGLWRTGATQKITYLLRSRPKKLKRGVWSGKFQKPWQWRKKWVVFDSGSRFFFNLCASKFPQAVWSWFITCKYHLYWCDDSCGAFVYILMGFITLVSNISEIG